MESLSEDDDFRFPISDFLKVTIMLSYFIVRLKSGIKVLSGLTWQEAVLSGYGHIDADMDIKCIGSNSYWAQKKSYIQRKLNEKEGWFKPMLLNDALLTISAEHAFGPPEISAKMASFGERVLACGSDDEITKIVTEASPYLRFLPLSLCQKFNDLVIATRQRLVSTPTC